MIKLEGVRFMRLILLFLLIIIPFQKSFADNCVQEFKPNTQQMLNDHKLGQYAAGLSKKSELNGKMGIITYGAATITVKKASMLRLYQQSAQISAQSNYLRFMKKSSSTTSGMITLERCTKDISGNALMIIKVFTPL